MGRMSTPLTPPTARTARHLRASDLRAAAQLATQATQAITRIAEGVHQSVWRTLGAPGSGKAERARGLTGLIYQGIHGATGLIGHTLDGALARLEPTLQSVLGQGDESPQRVALVAALCGVMGDRLAASGNALALPMTLRYQELSAQSSKGLGANIPVNQQLPNVRSKLLLVIHGLCMTDLQWNAQQAGQPVNHATALAQALGYTPVYLRYNSGLHISQNGQQLAALLEDLVARWPMALEHISVLAHSMGGLVMRSALHQATAAGMHWPKHLKAIAFLGTPHHGAPLERAGNWVDVLLGSTPYSRPFAKLGQLRSAGVTDLRHGVVLAQDWQGRDRFDHHDDPRTPLPLPADVACFAVAATLATRRGVVAERLLGDGLVPLRSALGQHDDPRHQLHFAPERQLLLYRTGHLQLLGNQAVTQQLLRWLGD